MVKTRNMKIEQLGSRNLMAADLAGGAEMIDSPGTEGDFQESTNGDGAFWGSPLADVELGDIGQVVIDTSQLESDHPEVYEALEQMLEEAGSELGLDDAIIEFTVDGDDEIGVIIDHSHLEGGDVFEFAIEQDMVDFDSAGNLYFGGSEEVGDIAPSTGETTFDSAGNLYLEAGDADAVFQDGGFASQEEDPWGPPWSNTSYSPFAGQ